VFGAAVAAIEGDSDVGSLSGPSDASPSFPL